MEKRRVNVRAIIWRDNQLLAVKHKNNDGTEADYWATPGGGLDPKEALTDGLARELREELGVEARIGKLIFVQQFASPSYKPGRKHEEELELFFAIDNPEDFETIDLASTSHGAEELARAEFINPSEERILPSFLSHTPLSDYLSGDKPVYIFDELPR